MRPTVAKRLNDLAAEVEIEASERTLDLATATATDTATDTATAATTAAAAATATAAAATTAAATAQGAAPAGVPKAALDTSGAAKIGTVPRARAKAPARQRIKTYGWDQNKETVKIYVTLPGVEDMDAAGMQFTADKTKAVLIVDNLNGKNHQLTIEVAKPIQPDTCAIKVKKGRLILNVKKQEAGTWGYLTAAEQHTADEKAPKVACCRPLVLGLLRQPGVQV